jgi:hypothetical protein
MCRQGSPATITDLQGIPAGNTEHVEVDGVIPVDGNGLRRWRASVLDRGNVLDEHGVVAVDLDGRITNIGHALGDGVRVDVLLSDLNPGPGAAYARGRPERFDPRG